MVAFFCCDCAIVGALEDVLAYTFVWRHRVSHHRTRKKMQKRQKHPGKRSKWTLVPAPLHQHAKKNEKPSPSTAVASFCLTCTIMGFLRKFWPIDLFGVTKFRTAVRPVAPAPPPPAPLPAEEAADAAPRTPPRLEGPPIAPPAAPSAPRPGLLLPFRIFGLLGGGGGGG